MSGREFAARLSRVKRELLRHQLALLRLRSEAQSITEEIDRDLFGKSQKLDAQRKRRQRARRRGDS